MLSRVREPVHIELSFEPHVLDRESGTLCPVQLYLGISIPVPKKDRCPVRAREDWSVLSNEDAHAADHGQVSGQAECAG